jgi:hypothetical protein
LFAGELYLEFTQIDPQQPERPFGFAVQVVGDDNRYTGKCNVSRSLLELQCRAHRQQQAAAADNRYTGKCDGSKQAWVADGAQCFSCSAGHACSNRLQHQQQLWS